MAEKSEKYKLTNSSGLFADDSRGCLTKDFDAFMTAHLTFADVTVVNDVAALRLAEAGIKRWEGFAG